MLTLNWTGKSVSRKQSEKGIRHFSLSVMLVSAFYLVNIARIINYIHCSMYCLINEDLPWAPAKKAINLN